MVWTGVAIEHGRRHRREVLPTALLALLAQQDGVVARRQVVAHGFTGTDLERWERRRELVRVSRGVYLAHTGVPTWRQRAWAAVLVHPQAVLDGATALRIAGVRSAVQPADQDRMAVAVPHGVHLKAPSGVTVRQMRGLDRVVHPAVAPPRVRIEVAALRAASELPRADAAIALLGDLCQRGHTTPGRLAEALAMRPNLPRRPLLVEVIDDAAEGAYSALERRYLRDVERAHGLPTGARQRRVAVGRSAAYRDVEYRGLGVVVELDGRLGHELARDRWDDARRDAEALAAGAITLRLSWAQVLEPCRTAVHVGRVLRLRGWDGPSRPCSSCAAPGWSG